MTMVDFLCVKKFSLYPFHHGFIFHVGNFAMRCFVFQILCQRYLFVPFVLRNASTISSGFQSVIDSVIFLLDHGSTIFRFFFIMSANFPTSFLSFIWSNAFTINGVITTHSKEILSAIMASTRNISNSHCFHQVGV